MTSQRWLWSCVAAVGIAVTVAAQTPKPTFEVASVRRNVTGSGALRGPRPGGEYLSSNAPLSATIQYAYDIQDYQLVGGPGWVLTDRFDISARAGREVPIEALKLMLQALLEDRFKLVLRKEQRELAVYALVLARADGRLGPGLRKADPACSKTSRDETRTPSGGISTRRTCAAFTTLVSILSSTLKAPVIDRTSLSGMWDYELAFTDARSARRATTADDPNDPPALLTAVPEQLGLTLERQRGPVDVLVIESVQPPTEN